MIWLVFKNFIELDFQKSTYMFYILIIVFFQIEIEQLNTILVHDDLDHLRSFIMFYD